MDDDSRFCTTCGKPVLESTPTTSSEITQSVQQENEVLPDHEILQDAVVLPTTDTQKKVEELQQKVEEPQQEAEQPQEAEKSQISEEKTAERSKKTKITEQYIKKVISQLVDEDIPAGSEIGEMRFTTSSAQNTFIKLLKKGFLTVMFLILGLGNTLAQDDSYITTRIPERLEVRNNYSESVNTEEASVSFSISGENLYINKHIETYNRRKSDQKNPTRTIEIEGMMKKGSSVTISFDASTGINILRGKYKSFGVSSMKYKIKGEYMGNGKWSDDVNGQGWLYYYDSEETQDPERFQDRLKKHVDNYHCDCDHLPNSYTYGVHKIPPFVRKTLTSTPDDRVYVIIADFLVTAEGGMGDYVDNSCTTHVKITIGIERDFDAAIQSLNSDAAGSQTPTSQQEDVKTNADANEEGGSMVVDTDANEEAGKEDSSKVPIGIIIGATAAAAGGFMGWNAYNNNRRPKRPKGSGGGSSDKDGKEEEDDEDDEDDKYTYEMRVTKHFGNTLRPTKNPAKRPSVYARFVKIDKNGHEVTDEALTRLIQITGDGFLETSGHSYIDDYMAAVVNVPDAEEMPEEGVINFTLPSAQGGFTKRVHFQLVKREILFQQENLTLPAVTDEVTQLPFYLYGFEEGEIASVEVTMDNEKTYTVCASDDDEDPLLKYAEITEVAKTTDKPGTCTHHELTIKVLTKEAEEVTEHFVIYRMQMGLKLGCPQIIGCYIEKYDSLRHSHHSSLIIETEDGKRYAPCQTTCRAAILSWNKDTHQLVQALPDPMEVDGHQLYNLHVFAEPVETESSLDNHVESLGTEGLSDQEFIEKVNLQYALDEVDDDLTFNLRLFATGTIDAPSRRKVKLVVEAEYKGEKYRNEQIVWFTSQPYRDMSLDQMRQFSKEDQEKTEALESMKRSLERLGAAQKKPVLLNFIQMMLDGYSIKFGYDDKQWEGVRNAYNSYVRGTIADNEQYNKVEELGLTCELMRAMAKTGEQLETFLEGHGGWKTRLAVGVATLGWSEVGMLSCKVPQLMIEEVEKGGDEWSSFKVGALAVGEQFAWEYGIGLAVKGGAAVFSKVRPDLAAKAAGTIEKFSASVKQRLGIFGKDVGELTQGLKKFATDKFAQKTIAQGKTSAKALRESAAKADEIVHKERLAAKADPKRVYTEEEILMETTHNAELQKGFKAVKETEKAYAEYMASGRSVDKLKVLEERMMELQSSKYNQMALLHYNSPNANNIRARFNDFNQAINRKVNMLYKEKAAIELTKQRGKLVSPDDIEIVNVSNSNKATLKAGETITRDTDFSAVVKGNKSGLGADTVDKEVEQMLSQKIFDECYTQVTGRNPRVMDQTVVQVGSKERFGSGIGDLQRSFDRSQMHQHYDDVQGVANACYYKFTEWVERGFQEKSAGIVGWMHNIEEGFRQAGKLAKNFLLPSAAVNNCINSLPAKQVEILRLLERQYCMEFTGPTTITCGELIHILRVRYNMKPQDVGTMLKEIVLNIEKFKH